MASSARLLLTSDAGTHVLEYLTFGDVFRVAFAASVDAASLHAFHPPRIVVTRDDLPFHVGTAEMQSLGRAVSRFPKARVFDLDLSWCQQRVTGAMRALLGWLPPKLRTLRMRGNWSRFAGTSGTAGSGGAAGGGWGSSRVALF